MHIKKEWQSVKLVWPPITKEPKICHALAMTSAFNLKLCRMFLDLKETYDENKTERWIDVYGNTASKDQVKLSELCSYFSN